MLTKCPCGSGKFPQLGYDARGIPLGYMCSECREKKLSKFRPECLTNPSYEADEDIEPEPGGLYA